MAKRVNLDAMIPREDFGRMDVDASIDLIGEREILGGQIRGSTCGLG
jgi:hypothetical protein